MDDSIMEDIGSSVKQKYQNTAMDAYDNGDYATAIENYTKALNIGEPDFTSMFYLAQSYQKSGDTDNAKTWYQKIIDTFPGTQNASDAQDYLDALTGGSSSSTASQSVLTQSQSQEDEDSEDEDTSDYEEDDSDYTDSEDEDTSNYNDEEDSDYNQDDDSEDDYSEDDSEE